MSFPRYSEYKDSGLDWIGEIPEGWDLKPLKYVVSCNDEALPDNTPPDFRIMYVEISDVDEVQGITNLTQVAFGQAPSRARRIARDGDVLVSTVRTYLRAIAPVEQAPNNLVASTGFAVIRPRYLHHRFAGYLLRAEWLISRIIARSVGVNYPAIRADEIIGLSVPVPSNAEQRQIADFLDHETAKIDALIEEQQRLIEVLEEKRQAVISHVVTKGLDPDAPMKDSGVEWLGEVPAHWEVLRIGALYRESVEAGIPDLPVLQVSIHDGVSDRELSEEESDRKITRIEDRAKYKRVRPGDLTYNMMRAWQGAFGAVRVDGLVSPAYIVARPARTNVSSFLERQLRTPNGIEEMRKNSYGITDFRLRLYWEQWKDIYVALPPENERIDISDFATTEESRVDALIDESRHVVGLLKERRSALISAAVTGKIDVRNWQPEADSSEGLPMAAEEPAAYETSEP